jgi:hypothetical protein
MSSGVGAAAWADVTNPKRISELLLGRAAGIIAAQLSPSGTTNQRSDRQAL